MREYVKPEFVYENFQLNHTIANCAAGGNIGKKPIVVGYEADGTTEMTLFTDSLGCTIPGTEETEYENYCIETGNESYGTFNS